MNCADGVGLQFTVTPDISSLDVSADKLKTLGVTALIEKFLQMQPAQTTGCGTSVQRVDFVEASKTPVSVSVSFRAYTAASAAGDGSARDPIQIGFQLKQE